MLFIFCIFFREGNQCADKLVMFGTRSQDYAWWDMFLTSFINFKILFNNVLVCHFWSPSTPFTALKTMQLTLLTGFIGGLLCTCPNHMDSTV